MKMQKGTPSDFPINSGMALMECTKIRAVMASTEEAEVGALLIYCNVAVGVIVALEYTVHPQLPTPVITDNSTACGIVNNSMK
eukprot:12735591-Ditylum_brightwellii.AAC.1